ncbi:MAG: hypothetical protein R3B82_24220 [Sandaracinaceae bacterium]
MSTPWPPSRTSRYASVGNCAPLVTCPSYPAFRSCRESARNSCARCWNWIDSPTSSGASATTRATMALVSSATLNGRMYGS